MAAISETPAQFTTGGNAQGMAGGQSAPYTKQNPADFKSTSLYVGDLAPDVAETTLFEVFNAVAPVSTIRVCRSALTRESLGYAYVNFQTPADAEKALAELNYTPIKGRPCRIMWSQRDPATRRNNVGNVFVKNLAPEITSKDLHDTFKLFGNISSCKVATDAKGASKGYGFVHFETDDAAKQAISGVNGMEFNGRPVQVTPYLPKTLRQGPEWTNLYVKNLPKHWDDQTLKEAFGAYGEIVSTMVSKDANGNSRGFGFVCFRSHASASAAMDTLNGKEIEGQPASLPPRKPAENSGKAEGEDGKPTTVKLYVGRAQKKQERERALKDKAESARRERLQKWHGCNLYVRNLDESVDDETLRREFAAYGTITSARIERDADGRSRLFGYVCYSSPEEATKAVQAMHHKLVQGKPLFVALWQPKEQRVPAVPPPVQRGQNFNAGRTAGNQAASGNTGVANPMQQLAQLGGVNPMQFMNPVLANLMAMQSNPAYAAAMLAQQGNRPGAGAGDNQGANVAQQQQIQQLQQLMMVNPMAYLNMMAAFSASAAGGRSPFANAAAGNRQVSGNPRGAQQQQQQQQGLPNFGAGGFNPMMLGFNPAMAAAVGQVGQQSVAGVPGPQQRAGGAPGGGRRQGGPQGGQQQVPGQHPGGTRVATGPIPQQQAQQRSGVPPAMGMAGAPARQAAALPPQQQTQPGPRAGMPAVGQRAPIPGGVVQGGPGSMQYRPGARNVDGSTYIQPPGGETMMGMMPMGMPGAAGMPMPLPQARSDFAATLAAASPQQQKNMIGEQLYNQIMRSQPERVGKITGMLLDGMDTSELLHLLESPQDLQARIHEAIEVLRNHEETSKKAAETA